MAQQSTGARELECLSESPFVHAVYLFLELVNERFLSSVGLRADLEQ